MQEPALTRTLGRVDAEGGVPAVSATMAGIGLPEPPAPVDLGETVYGESVGDAGPPAQAPASPGRTTVLPRRSSQAAAAVAEVRPRFDRVRLLGEGGMGEVELARDNDIRRTVAVKRLRAGAASDEALLRFADEVRIVGQLEHPSIVPVYDVGRDDSGHVYLVMKHLTGETMEEILARLRARDPATAARFGIAERVHVFLGVLDAIRYAHARGVLHRDLKPANVMIGPYGEVTVLDWGIAKPIRRPGAAGDVSPLERTLVESQDKRLQQTQLGALAGTPLYMSPEQAAGRNDELDERSDVYALCVLFYEWLALEHPLRGKKTVTEVLAAIISEDYDPATFERALVGGVPVEYVRVLEEGIRRNVEARFQSVAELERAVQDARSGRIAIRCPVTLAKRTAHEVVSWIDRHPVGYSMLFFAAVGGLLATVGVLAYLALRS